MSVGPPDTKAVLLYFVAPLAISSIVMVLTMVRFSLAVLESRTRAAWRWGIAYGLSWAAVLAVILRALLDPADPQARESLAKNLVFIALFAGGWWGLNGLLIWFGRALARANARASAAAAQADRQAPEEAEAEAEAPPADEEAEAEPGPPSRARRAGKKLPRPLRRVVGWGVTLLAVLVAIILGELPPLKALEYWTEVHQTPLLAVVSTLAALGFVLMMGGAIHLVLTQGQPMSQREVEAQVRLNRNLAARPHVWRKSGYRIRGKTVGAQAEGEASFAELKAAWRTGAWRRTRRLRRLFVMGAGGLLMAFGLFGIFVVVGPAWVKLIVGAAMLFAATKLIQGFHQA